MSATEKATLEARIDELCAENERLRERLKASEDGRMRQADNLIDKYHKIARLQTEYASLRDENERLRSVVSDGADNAREIMAENAKLREQIHWLKKGDILHVLTDQEYIDQCERERLMQVSIDALDKENAKLRELIRELFRDFANADYELKSRCGRTFMAVTRYLPRLQELEVEP